MTTMENRIITRMQFVAEGEEEISKSEQELGKLLLQERSLTKAEQARAKTLRQNIQGQKLLTSEAKKSIGAFKGVRLEFLGVMFGGQALAKGFSRLTNPMKDAVGITDLLNAQLLDATAGGIDPLIKATETFGKGLKKVDGIMGGNLGTTLLFGEALGTVLGGVGQTALFVDSLAGAFGNIPGFGGLFGALSGATGNVAFRGATSNLDKAPIVLGGKILPLGNLLAKGIAIGVGFFMIKDAFSDFTSGNIAGGIGNVVGLGGLVQVARGRFRSGGALLVAGVALELIGDLTRDDASFGDALINAIGGGAQAAGLVLAFRGGHPVLSIGLLLVPTLAPLFKDAMSDYRRVMSESGLSSSFFGSTADLFSGRTRAAIRSQRPELFAHGGIVTRPTLGMVGEAGPEAIIPLSEAGGMGGVNIGTINLNSTLTSQNASAVAREFAEELRRQTGNRMTGVR